MGKLMDLLVMACYPLNIYQALYTELLFSAQ